MTLSRPVRAAIFSALMLACAAASNAVMDCLSSHYSQSIFSNFPSHRQWLDPAVSWKNKWKDGDHLHGEAFPLSSTTFVFLTDGWHCFKSLTIQFISLALVAPFTLLFRLRWYGWLGVLAGINLLYGVVFESFYAHFFIRG